MFYTFREYNYWWNYQYIVRDVIITALSKCERVWALARHINYISYIANAHDSITYTKILEIQGFIRHTFKVILSNTRHVDSEG